VCQFWKHASNKASKEKFVFELLCHQEERFNFAPEPGLVNAIKVVYNYCLNPGVVVTTEMFEKIVGYLSLNSKSLVEIRFKVDSVFMATLRKILVKVADAGVFPKLKKLVIEETWPGIALHSRSDEALSGVTLNQIEWIEFTGHSNVLASDTILQEMIECCPNILGIKIIGNVYPVLSNCRGLKSLEWQGFAFRRHQEYPDYK
jgi:hypothetical protein